MRTALTVKLLPMAVLLAMPAAAQIQNMDMSMLFGPSVGTSQVVSGIAIRSEGGRSFLVNYGYHICSIKGGDVYIETPITSVSGGNVTIDNGGTVVASNQSYFFTPGARLKIHLDSRVSVYGIGDLGYGSFGESVATIKNGTPTVTVNRSYHLVGAAGAGLEFRVATHFSLRAELRDFISDPHLGGTDSRHHPVYGFGFAFHF